MSKIHQTIAHYEIEVRTSWAMMLDTFLWSYMKFSDGFGKHRVKLRLHKFMRTNSLIHTYSYIRAYTYPNIDTYNIPEHILYTILYSKYDNFCHIN